MSEFRKRDWLGYQGRKLIVEIEAFRWTAN